MPKLTPCQNCRKPCNRIFCCLDCAEERWSIQQEAFDCLMAGLDDALLEAGRPRSASRPLTGKLAVVAAAAAVYTDDG